MSDSIFRDSQYANMNAAIPPIHTTLIGTMISAISGAVRKLTAIMPSNGTEAASAK